MKRSFFMVLFIVLGSLSASRVVGQETTQNTRVSSVLIVHGSPALFVNDQQKSLILAAPYQQGPRDFNTFRAGGIEIFNGYLHFPWTGPDQWDFSRADANNSVQTISQGVLPNSIMEMSSCVY